MSDLATAELLAQRRRIVAALGSLDASIEGDRRLLREQQGLPVLSWTDEIGTPAVPGETDAASVVRARLTRAHARRDVLRRQLRQLDLGGTSPDQCEQAAIAWLNGVHSPEQLRDELVADPSLLPLSPPGFEPITAKVARAALRARDRLPNRRLLSLADIAGEPDVDRRVIGHLLHTGCRLAQRQEPEQPALEPGYDVGVLLPLRLETRFSPGRLCIRIVPDEPWFVGHDPRFDEGELTALARFLEALTASSGDPAAIRLAWSELVTHVGGPRAVMLLRRSLTVDESGRRAVRTVGPSQLRTEPAFSAVVGLPTTLHLWLARAGGEPELAHTLTVDHTRVLADFPDPDVPSDRRWWESWDEAVGVGLAADLPLDGDPDDIDVLYVTGLGTEHPGTLFGGHREAGSLGVVAPGTPTNSVEGAAAADLGQDAQTWWDIVHEPPSDGDRLISLALTGDALTLGTLPGPAEPHRQWGSAMVSALWPALWGFAGHDVWNLNPFSQGADWVSRAAGWAAHALHPEGPFPTVRVGSQPYGLLPATLTARWVMAEGDPDVEANLFRWLPAFRRMWVDAAEARGTVVGASTDALLDLLADVPTSPAYRHRRAWPLDLWWLVLLLCRFRASGDDLDRRWHAQYPLVRQLGLEPVRRYGARAASRPVTIPLVPPADGPGSITAAEALRKLVDVAFEAPGRYRDTRALQADVLGQAPDSVLVNLAIRSLQVAIGDVGRERFRWPHPDPERVIRDADSEGVLEHWISLVEPQHLQEDAPAAAAMRRVAEGLLTVAEIPEPRVDALLRATIDTATHRLDPWLVGPAARRLQDLLDTKTAALRLGAYGWVDAPRPGKPGPTPAGLVHAPSPAQALTATVLRDRAVNDPEASRWNLDLTSASVRAADRIAEHVRQGAHFAEGLGREVERIVTVPADVEALRRQFPVRTEHAGRRVCDGQAVLAAEPSTLGLDADRLAELARLRTAVDAYGDLLVAEAVHHVTEGRADVAGAVMDAAAGLSRPPHLALLHSPREGRAVATSVVILLRAVLEPPLPATELERAEMPPSVLADAAAAAFVSEQLGEAAEWGWEVESVDERGEGTGVTTAVTLADVGLAPADALALVRTDLERLVRDAGAVALGVAGQRAVIVSADGSARYERAARLTTLVGRAPAGPDAVTEKADAIIESGPANVDLLRRYGLVHAVAVSLVAALDAELVLADPDGGLGGADAAVLGRLVVAARSWGIAPDPPPEAPDGMDPVELDERRLVALAARVHALLSIRVAAAPVPAATTLPSADLVDAMAALVSPTGQMAITGRLTAAELPPLDRATAGGTAQPLDDTWLPVVAAVREPLARVEVHQLSSATPVGTGPVLVPWATKPDDPWQADAGDPRRLVVVYAPRSIDVGALPADAPVAVASLDRWTEAIPAQEQTTAAAFGFDAPASRAPQAVLLAVPPDLEAGLADEKTVVGIVAEARELAHARMARATDLPDQAHALLPTVLVPAAGATAVSFEPRPEET